MNASFCQSIRIKEELQGAKKPIKNWDNDVSNNSLRINLSLKWFKCLRGYLHDAFKPLILIMP